jgi:hypothetical protein
MFEGRAAIGYDHGYDGCPEVLTGLTLDPKYVEGFIEGCLKKDRRGRAGG